VDELTGRVVALTRWTRCDPDMAGLPLGYFATGLGAAAALRAAAELDGEIGAVVCSQGRADLVGAGAAAVTAATLLVVAGADPVTLDRNGGLEPLLRCRSALEIVPGASRRLDEVGAVDRVVDLATDWFRVHLAGHRTRPVPATL
jgi:putative phosphoribosyl transferase